MLSRPPSSFQQGARVQIILGKDNLECGAGDVYPNKATGTIAFPYYTDQEGNVDFDARRVESLAYQRIAYVLLDNSSVEHTIPEWLLQSIF